MEYFVYCDESEERGKKFSKFYGGALVRSIHLREVVDSLEGFKKNNSLTGEVKWTKVTEQYLDRYVGLMDVFFDLIREDKIKMRVMFQQNEFSDPRLRGLTKEQRERSFFLLYYQFFKHAFGLQHSNSSLEPIFVRIFFDQFPDTKEKVDSFKEYIHRLQYQPAFQEANLRIRYEDIVEVTSHNHVVLQCADIVTGSMFFRLNELHKVIPEGQRVRGKRTRAKEKLYNHINARIRDIYPNFNIGISTGFKNDVKNLWNHPYRHWCFLPNHT